MPPNLPRLIVNADDFGYTEGVNQAILELHQAGVLSSATLMSTSQTLESAVIGARRIVPDQASPEAPRPEAAEPTLGRLGIGCHVVLVDGTSLLPAGELRTLVSPATKGKPDGGLASFRPTLGAFTADLLRGRIHEDEIENETIAQIRALQSRGIHVTHLDTHKHTHMFPRVLRPLLRAALRCGVSAIRNPFEPAWSVRASRGAPLVRRTEVRLLALLRPEFTRLVAQAGLSTTAGAIGVLATGTLDGTILEQLLTAALRAADPEPDRVWELVCHPGYHDAALSAQRTRLQEAREIERCALLGAKTSLEGFRLIHFGDLP